MKILIICGIVLASLILLIFVFILGIGLGIYHTKKQFLNSLKSEISKKHAVNNIIKAINQNNPALIKLQGD